MSSSSPQKSPSKHSLIKAIRTFVGIRRSSSDYRRINLIAVAPLLETRSLESDTVARVGVYSLCANGGKRPNGLVVVRFVLAIMF